MAGTTETGDSPIRRRATITEVAAAAGVSAPTVSRVVTGSANVSPQTRARVEKAIERLNYRPSAIARALSYGKTMSIGAIVPFLTHPSAVQRVRGLVDGLRASPFPLTLYDVEEPHDRVEHFEAVTSVHPPMGTIVVSLRPSPDELAVFETSTTPVVFIDVDVPGFSWVSVDHRAGGRMAAQHLTDLGHERIGFVGDAENNPLGFTSSALHRLGYHDALGEAGIAPAVQLEKMGRHGRDAARSLALELLKAHDPPTGIVAASDTQALGVTDAASELGIDVPGDLSVIGFDDIDMSALVGLTTIRQPLEISGCLAAEILIAAIETPDAPRVTERLPLGLVVRETTGPPQSKQ